MTNTNTWLIIAGFLVTLVVNGMGFASSRRKITQIHLLVNSRMTRVMARVDQLEHALIKSGADIPLPPDDDPHVYGTDY